MAESLTARQREVYDLIERRIRADGIPPTMREFGDALGIKSTNGTTDHLRALERKGWIGRDPLKSRGIRLTKPLPPDLAEALRVGEGTPWPLGVVLRELALEVTGRSTLAPEARRALHVAAMAYAAGRMPQPGDTIADLAEEIGRG